MGGLLEVGNDNKDNLWKKWFKEHSIAARNQLVLFYSTWCTKQAKNVFFKYPNPSLELADYIHWATIGLIESIERYEPSKGHPFEAFAVFRVKGEILNHLSKTNDQSAYASARNKVLNERVEAILESTEQTNQFNNTLEFIKFFSIGVSLEELSIETEIIDGASYHEDHLLKKHIKNAVGILSDKERSVINYHYKGQLSFTEIGELLSVSKGRISQIHSSALKKLSTRILSHEVY